MSTIRKICQWYVAALVVAWFVPMTCFSTVAPDEIGIRQSNFSGVSEADLEPGWALRIPGAHKIITLPRRYEYLDYTSDDMGPQQPLQIRTKDNNIVFIDVSVPYHVLDEGGWKLVKAGNHQQDADGRHRFQRLAEETTVSVLRERLAELSSADFYSTDRRLAVADSTLEILNGKLAELHVEAEGVLIRAVEFRPEYERQLMQIQLNEQKKLLDEASEAVAKEQQKLDNFAQGTNAMAAAAEQAWIERRSGIERAYQMGVIDVGDQIEVGSARRVLEALTDEERAGLVKLASEKLGFTEDEVSRIDDAFLLGIRNISAETLEYDRRIRTEADGISQRLEAEGAATLAEVRGAYEGRVNELLNSSAGRAYVAWKTAENVTFDNTLVFSSSDGVPSVLQLRKFTEMFMGR